MYSILYCIYCGQSVVYTIHCKYTTVFWTFKFFTTQKSPQVYSPQFEFHKLTEYSVQSMWYSIQSIFYTVQCTEYILYDAFLQSKVYIVSTMYSVHCTVYQADIERKKSASGRSFSNILASHAIFVNFATK